MKVYVDETKCQGHARCYGSAPQLYDVDDLGHGVTRGDVVPDGLEDLARLTADNCPERAITVEESL